MLLSYHQFPNEVSVCRPSRSTKRKIRTACNYVNSQQRLQLLQPSRSTKRKIRSATESTYSRKIVAPAALLSLFVLILLEPSKVHACMVGEGLGPCSISTAAEGAPGPHGNLVGNRVGTSCMSRELHGNRTRPRSIGTSVGNLLELVGPSHVAHTGRGEAFFCRVAGRGYLRMAA